MAKTLEKPEKNQKQDSKKDPDAAKLPPQPSSHPVDTAREAAHTANNYAHDEPWHVAGGALAVGVLLGFLLGRR